MLFERVKINKMPPALRMHQAPSWGASCPLGTITLQHVTKMLTEDQRDG
jgi:hypothetical protein